MQRKSMNRIGVVLFLLAFGSLCLVSGLISIFRSNGPLDAGNLLVTVVGVLSIILAVYLMKKRWF